MTYYAAQNPYRNSTGGLNLSSHSRSPPRTQIIIPVRPPSPAHSDCSSCEGSLPLNTPWSDTPTSSGPHLQDERHHQGERVCTRTTRRMSIHSEGGHHHRPDPLVIRGESRYVSSAPLSAPLQERRTYRTDHSARTLIVPSSSMERSRRSTSTDHHRRSASTSRTSYSKYHHGIEQFDEEYNDGTTVGRRGRTRFPRRLVSREAVEQLGLPWTEEHDGAIVVLRALDRTEIERLVDLTEEVRRRRNGSSGKSVSFIEKAIVHDLPPRAPSPPPLVNERIVHHYTNERPSSSLTSENISNLNTRGHDSSFSHTTTTTTTTMTEEPILLPIHIIPPGATGATKVTTFTTPSFPLPQDSLSRAEEKAIKAEEKAIKLEVKADMTGSRRDEQEAYRARLKAEEKKKKFEEKEWKERVKREEKEVRRIEERRIDEREVLRTRKNHKGETVIIR